MRINRSNLSRSLFHIYLGALAFTVQLPTISVHVQPKTWFCRDCHRQYRYLGNATCRCGGKLWRIGSHAS